MKVPQNTKKSNAKRVLADSRSLVKLYAGPLVDVLRVVLIVVLIVEKLR